jgi:hypothetical protein
MSCMRTWRRRIGRAALAAAVVWGVAAPVAEAGPVPAAAEDGARGVTVTLVEVVGQVLDALGLVDPAPGIAREPGDGTDRAEGGLGPLIDPNGGRPGGTPPKPDKASGH